MSTMAHCNGREGPLGSRPPPDVSLLLTAKPPLVLLPPPSVPTTTLCVDETSLLTQNAASPPALQQSQFFQFGLAEGSVSVRQVEQMAAAQSETQPHQQIPAFSGNSGSPVDTRENSVGPSQPPPAATAELQTTAAPSLAGTAVAGGPEKQRPRRAAAQRAASLIVESSTAFGPLAGSSEDGAPQSQPDCVWGIGEGWKGACWKQRKSQAVAPHPSSFPTCLNACRGGQLRQRR
jgi:hypothetical protein